MKKLVLILGCWIINFSSTIYADEITENQTPDGWELLPEAVLRVGSSPRLFNLWLGVPNYKVDRLTPINWQAIFEEAMPSHICMQKDRNQYNDIDWMTIDGSFVPISIRCAGVHRIMVVSYPGIVRVYQSILMKDFITMWTSHFQVYTFENRYSPSDMVSATDKFDGRDLMKWIQFGDVGMDPEFVASYSSLMPTIHRIFGLPE